MAAFYTDTFTAADGTNLSAHTSDSGHNYEAHGSFGGTVEVRTNRIHATAGASYRRPVVTPPSADYETTGLLYVHSDDDNFVSVGGRASDSGQYVTIFNISGEIQLWGGSALVTGLSVTPQAGETHRIKCSHKGTLIRGFHNRREFGFATDSGIAGAGKPTFGFLDSTGNTAGVHLDSAYANALFDESQIMFVGDSITAGYGLTLAESYPSKVIASLADGATDWANRGVTGRTLATMLTSVAEITDCSRTAATRNIVVLMGGANDLAGGATAQDVIDDLTAYAAAVQLAGQSVIVCTITYADESHEAIPAGFNTARGTVNTWIQANANLFDGVADTSTALGSDPANFDDHIHPSDAGATLIASTVTTAIQAMENPPTYTYIGLGNPLIRASR